ncbi:MAG: DUF3536 domain-containing protein, partial [Candidatus Omnitrophota bacterium]
RVNNFTKISYDMGPTLLSWLRRKKPETYRAIIDADRLSVTLRNGHGNAMAQCYNHLIMPLAKKRDKITQIVWGIRDFEFHYKRKPEGMWLPEAAVDRETLKLMAERGILFTVLCPSQASRVRKIGFGKRWEQVRGESINPKQAYRILLEWGKQFHVFFYDAPLSRAIAFEGLLGNGDLFDYKLMNAFGRARSPQLVTTATDGESFGHHHKFGDMAIAYALKKVEDQHLATLTNYGDYLERFGSDHEADIFENSSWSCYHGIERWRSDCGCRINLKPGWNQKWRAILREAFEYLQKTIDELFESKLDGLIRDPWSARNDYIEVMLDPGLESRQRYLERHAVRELNPEEKKMAWDLLEAEKFSLYMYTSCGWFFDDISGIEAVQVMKFALRAIELVGPYTPQDVEVTVVQILHHAKSNLPDKGTGADIFNRDVKKSRPTEKR